MTELTAIISKEDNTFIAECLEVGTISQGGTIEEAICNLKEATILYLEEFPYVQKDIKIVTNFEIACPL